MAISVLKYSKSFLGVNVYHIVVSVLTRIYDDMGNDVTDEYIHVSEYLKQVKLKDSAISDLTSKVKKLEKVDKNGES